MGVEEDKLPREHDPGDAVPPGVAPQAPPPPTEGDRKVKRKLERDAEAARRRGESDSPEG
jgi:hypothetical protein